MLLTFTLLCSTIFVDNTLAKKNKIRRPDFGMQGPPLPEPIVSVLEQMVEDSSPSYSSKSQYTSLSMSSADHILPSGSITPPPSPTTSCIPTTVCFDGITCGVRYGGCYDENHCNGVTSSFATPTCSSSPAEGFTNKHQHHGKGKKEKAWKKKKKQDVGKDTAGVMNVGD